MRNKEKEMKKLILPMLIILLFLGCATTNHKRDSIIIDNENETLKLYNSYPINIPLNENKKLINQLNNGLLTYEEYDSLLTKSGRIPSRSILIENCICNTNNAKSFKEALRAEHFFKADSLISIVKKRMESLIKTDSTYTMPYIYLCIINYDNHNIDEALKLINIAINSSENIENSGLHIFKAEIYEDNEDYIGASKEYEIAFSKNDELFKDYWKELFLLYLNSDQLDKAENLISLAEKSSQDSNFKKNHLNLLTELYWEKGEFEDSQFLCESLCDSTNSKYIDKELLNLLIMQNKFDEAKNKLLELSSIDFSWSLKPNLIFPEFDSLDFHYSEVLHKLKQAIDASQNNGNANFCYGYLIVSEELNKYYKDINAELMRKGLAYIKKSNITNSEINYIIGYILLELDNQQQALKHFSKIQEQSKYYPYSLVNRAILMKDDDINLAISFLQKAQKILPNEHSLFEEIGDYYYDFKDYPNSITWYEKYLSYEPNDNLAAIYLAKSYLYSDQLHQALTIINNTIDNLYTIEDNWSKEWNISLAYKTKGDINCKFEKWEQAKRDYEKSIEYDSDEMDTRLSLAKVYYQLDDLQLAEMTYLSVIDSVRSKDSIQSHKYAYYKALGELNWHYLIYVPNPIKRAEIFEQAVNHFPSDDWCYRNLGSANADQEKYYQAKQSFERAIEINPKEYLNYSFLASALKKEKKYEDAIYNYKRAINVIIDENVKIDKEANASQFQSNLSSIGVFHSVIAEIYKTMEEYDLSIFEYERAISVVPDTTGILYKFDLAGVYFDNKDYDNAISNYKLVFDKNNDLFSLYNIGLSYLNIGKIKNLNNAKTYFEKVIDLGLNKPEYDDLTDKSKEMKKIANEQINLIEWPTKIEDNVKSDNKTISSIAKIYKLTNDYRELNNMFLDGIKKTTPQKEYLEYSKEWIITSYNVSSKIFQSESLCDRFKSKISLIDTKNDKIIELKSLCSLAAETRKEGIKLYSQGYYVKAKDYSGEYERGRAKIDVANQYYADGLKILKSLMQKNIEHFSNYGIETINDMIKYYEHKE
jgi:tetratricopeptide (TPR) repeat protein